MSSLHVVGIKCVIALTKLQSYLFQFYIFHVVLNKRTFLNIILTMRSNLFTLFIGLYLLVTEKLLQYDTHSLGP